MRREADGSAVLYMLLPLMTGPLVRLPRAAGTLGAVDGLTIKTREEFERNGNWLLVRRGLGLSSFGMNLVEIPPGERIPEHDESERDHEEVFVVLSGSATLLVDGTEHPAPAGTYARLDPELTRTVVNTGDEPAAVLIVSAPRTSGYEPLSWA